MDYDFEFDTSRIFSFEKFFSHSVIVGNTKSPFKYLSCLWCSYLASVFACKYVRVLFCKTFQSVNCRHSTEPMWKYLKTKKKCISFAPFTDQCNRLFLHKAAIYVQQVLNVEWNCYCAVWRKMALPKIKAKNCVLLVAKKDRSIFQWQEFKKPHLYVSFILTCSTHKFAFYKYCWRWKENSISATY